MSHSYPLPTIHVDTREDTRPHPFNRDELTGTDMLSLVQSHRFKPAAESRLLPAGDFCFAGEGKDGPVLVGVERKRLRDMLSSIRSGRFSGEQLPKLITQYDHRYLILESRWRTEWETGHLIHQPYNEKESRFSPKWYPVSLSTKEVPIPGLFLSSFLSSITAHAPISLISTTTPEETVDAIMTLAHSWSKPYDKHHAHIAVHTPVQYASIEKASTVRRVCHALKDIGWERSGVIEKEYRSVESMVHRTKECDKGCGNRVCEDVTAVDFKELAGFGKVTATKLYNQLHGYHQED